MALLWGKGIGKGHLGKGASGIYAYRNGKVVKISDKKSHIKDFVFEKHKINGDKDTYDMYKHLENKGQLNKVNDNWKQFFKYYKNKYGE